MSNAHQTAILCLLQSILKIARAIWDILKMGLHALDVILDNIDLVNFVLIAHHILLLLMPARISQTASATVDTRLVPTTLVLPVVKGIIRTFQEITNARPARILPLQLLDLLLYSIAAAMKATSKPLTTSAV